MANCASRKKTYKMLCDPGESEGSMGRGWAPWEAVRSERGKTTSEDLKLNRRVRKEERLFAWLSNSAIPVGWRELGVVFFLSGRKL